MAVDPTLRDRANAPRSPAPQPAEVGVLMADGALPRTGGADRPVTEVAVGVLFDAQGRFLLTTRPPGKAYAGYWEFPGGKVEPGETVVEALRRELQEEIGVTVGAVHRWRETLVDYPHALVRLNFCRVYDDWVGDLHMHEGQQFAWQTLPVHVSPVLPGTVPVLAWLADEPSSPA